MSTDTLLSTTDFKSSSSSLSSSSVASQITRYENFIEVVLKGDLNRINQEQQQIHERVAEYTNIKATIVNLHGVDSFKSMSDLGSNCYVQCVVPKADSIYLNIGLDCYIQLRLSEASEFIDKRIELYQQTLEKLMESSSKVKAHIKLVLNLIDQLRSLSA